MAIPNEVKKYTADEFFSIVEKSNERFELISGDIIAMASPSTIHQELVMQLSWIINSYIKSNSGGCKVFPAPYDVKLDDENVVIPDISVICDQSKIDAKRCNGSPDWIIEVVSTNWKDDYYRKLELYQRFGVREYWIVDPNENRTIVHFFESKVIGIYKFNQSIEVNIYKDKPIKLDINVSNLLDL